MNNELIKQLQEIKLDENSRYIMGLSNRPVARLEDVSDGQIVYDMKGQQVYKWFSSRNETHDAKTGKSLGYGNRLLNLIYTDPALN